MKMINIKKIISIAGILMILVGVILFIDDCRSEDNTLYWPNSLAYESYPAKARFGDWQSTAGNKLEFHSSPSNRWARLTFTDSGTDQGAGTVFYLVTFIEGESFTIKKDNTEYTITYSLINDVLNIIDNDGSDIIIEGYNKL